MPRAKRTEQEIEEMRERILDAALDLLRQEGLDRVSIRNIADRVGVSHMLLYSYFENRAAMIQSLRERGFGQMEAFFAESLRRAETDDALVQLRASLGRFIQLSHDYPKLYQLAWRSATSWQVDSENLTAMLDHISRLIELCIERGQCIERDPALAAVMVFGIVNGTLMVHRSISALCQTEQAQLEQEIIEAAITYLTK
ncbi:MAG: TetR/AcrR family transcriptional regulator [Anaerolineae bacterium]|nr:TetR/AcrR family transcriptional regulator [Anaerolineae bacterium]